MRVTVGSGNPVKVEAVERVFVEVFGGEDVDLEVEGVEVDSGVPEQPVDGETSEGARNRAEEAFGGEVDFSVGIEAGLLTDSGLGSGPVDLQVCSVYDGERHTVGSGPGFRHPKEVIERVGEGETVGSAFEELFDESEVGKRMGAIGLLTGGLLDRRELTESAVLMALVPRIRPKVGSE